MGISVFLVNKQWSTVHTAFGYLIGCKMFTPITHEQLTAAKNANIKNILRYFLINCSSKCEMPYVILGVWGEGGGGKKRPSALPIFFST